MFSVTTEVVLFHKIERATRSYREEDVEIFKTRRR